jgi:hypothetical protein
MKYSSELGQPNRQSGTWAKIAQGYVRLDG